MAATTTTTTTTTTTSGNNTNTPRGTTASGHSVEHTDSPQRRIARAIWYSGVFPDNSENAFANRILTRALNKYPGATEEMIKKMLQPEGQLEVDEMTQDNWKLLTSFTSNDEHYTSRYYPDRTLHQPVQESLDQSGFIRQPNQHALLERCIRKMEEEDNKNPNIRGQYVQLRSRTDLPLQEAREDIQETGQAILFKRNPEILPIFNHIGELMELLHMRQRSVEDFVRACRDGELIIETADQENARIRTTPDNQLKVSIPKHMIKKVPKCIKGSKRKRALKSLQENKKEFARELADSTINFLHNETVLTEVNETRFRNAHPSILQAYLLFENLWNCCLHLNRADATSIDSHDTEGKVLMYCLKLLLPHALRARQVMGLPLHPQLCQALQGTDNNDFSNALSMINGIQNNNPVACDQEPDDSTDSDLIEDPAAAKKRAKNRAKKQRQKANRAKKKLQERQAQAQPLTQAPPPSSPTAAQRQGAETTTATASAATRPTRAQRKQAHQKTLAERKANVASKTAKRTAAKKQRTAARAQQFQEEEAARTAAAAAKRVPNSKTYALVTTEDFAAIHAALKGKNLDRLNRIFGTHADLNTTMNHHNIKTLVSRIADIMRDMGNESADDFLTEVLNRIHPAHKSSDTGNKLPANFVEILRSSLIIFGIFPRDDWQPSTSDHAAMGKFYSRQMDRLIQRGPSVE